MLGTKQKRPSDVLDFDINYEDWLPYTDAITTVVTAVSPTGELQVDSTQVSGQIVKVWLSGGVSGSSYEVNVTVSTSGGRVKEECFKIRVRDC